MYALDMGVSRASRGSALRRRGNRHESQQHSGLLEAFVGQRSRDRVALVVFSKRHFPRFHSPLIMSFSSGPAPLTSRVIEDGTAIGNALASTLRLEDSKAASKVVVLVTDGKNTAGNVEPLDAARAAAGAGVRVDTVLIGSDLPNVPVWWGSKGEPQIVQARLEADPDLLGSIAQLSGENSTGHKMKKAYVDDFMKSWMG